MELQFRVKQHVATQRQLRSRTQSTHRGQEAQTKGQPFQPSDSITEHSGRKFKKSEQHSPYTLLSMTQHAITWSSNLEIRPFN